MSDIKIPWKGWVLVCDGAKALVLENHGDAAHLNLTTLDAVVEPALPTRELGTDRPGRSRDSHGTGSSGMEQTDLQALAEADFLKGVAARLDDSLRADKYRHLVIVAAPKALGVLRQHLTPAVQGVVSGELAKDFTNLPVADIERHLAA